MMHARLRKPAAAGLAVLATCTLVAGCSRGPGTTGAAASGGEQVEIDLGDQTVTVSGPPRIAVVLPGTNNSYLQAQIDEVEDAVAEIEGATYTVFDGKFDPTTQFNALTNIVQGGQYNAILLPSLDSNLNCNVASKVAPENDIVVVAMTTALCGRTTNEGEELWQPGTLTYLGGVDTVDYWTDYLEYVIAENPGEQKMVVLKGPDNIGITINLDAAIEKVTAEHPELEIVGQANTDYSIPDGNEKATSLLQAHPDATIVFSAYVTLTQGAVQAVEAAGLEGDVKIYDKGSSEYSFEQLAAGTIEATAPEYPRTIVRKAVEVLGQAFAGEEVQRFYPNSGAPLPEGADPETGFFVITEDTAADFQPES
ncbi:sugar ABC transporter substrate-binding protein [Nocardioides zeae]|uniref:Sugar ABC transporter substrate-binding protein n=1 Tax=Nocardioides zeae TaxID=1457234 RepID=A0A6P0HJW0_9ACTN|nr:sugar ABC transporter substrate-binding protein [Nocardioides zeae]NEN78550.1 sugar ABC transporter substrate-binding protein [Nocardioides zeae]